MSTAAADGNVMSCRRPAPTYLERGWGWTNVTLQPPRAAHETAGTIMLHGAGARHQIAAACPNNSHVDRIACQAAPPPAPLLAAHLDPRCRTSVPHGAGRRGGAQQLLEQRPDAPATAAQGADRR